MYILALVSVRLKLISIFLFDGFFPIENFEFDSWSHGLR